MRARGDYIDGRFVPATGEPLVSRDPARGGDLVFESRWSLDHVEKACRAAANAQPAWAARSFEARWSRLMGVRRALGRRAGELATLISKETGKVVGESRAEVEELVSEFARACVWARRSLSDDRRHEDRAGDPSYRGLPESGAYRQLPDHPRGGAAHTDHVHEMVRYAPLGVVAVIGPRAFPLQFAHVDVVHALLTGNTVVLKPSEMAPHAAQLYAGCFEAAGLDAGVFNLVQGPGQAGAALAESSRIHGLCFTGSYAVGSGLARLALERPDLRVALQMGGKNVAVVCADADLRQAIHEISVGAFATTGQRATATSRVMVHASLQGALVDGLKALLGEMRFGDPFDGRTFAGPLSSSEARHRFEQRLALARDAGAEIVVEGGRLPGGAFITPSIHMLPPGCHHLEDYTDVELFGPDLAVEVFEDDEEALVSLSFSDYGLVTSVFSADRERFNRYLASVPSGVVQWNRGTHEVSPRLPLGGLGRSGNHRPAGAWAGWNSVRPVAVTLSLPGALRARSELSRSLPPTALDDLSRRHEADERDEAARRLPEAGGRRPLAVRLPPGGERTTSAYSLGRLSAGAGGAEQVWPLVVDPLRSAGPYLTSIDEPPLSILDASSYAAPAGLNADRLVGAYFEGEFGPSPDGVGDDAVQDQARSFCEVLGRELGPDFPHIGLLATGSESVELAIMSCWARALEREGASGQAEGGPSTEGGEGEEKRPRCVLAFEGGCHGETALARWASWDGTDEANLQLAQIRCEFAPFPVWHAPCEEEPFDPDGFAELLGEADIEGLIGRLDEMVQGISNGALLRAEVASLAAVDQALRSGEVFVCLVQPLQARAGDRYATGRFFRGLRLLTRAHGVPLVFDERDTGFGLGGSFCWYEHFGLIDAEGGPDSPDAVILGGPAQMGVLASAFPQGDGRGPEAASQIAGFDSTFEAAALTRGRLQAELAADPAPVRQLAGWVAPRLEDLARRYPHLVHAPRCRGLALAFDLPSNAQREAFLAQRWWRGLAFSRAGARSVQLRLNRSYEERDVERLFVVLRRSLSWLDAHPGCWPPRWDDAGAHPANGAQAPRDIASEGDDELRVRPVGDDEHELAIERVMALETVIYEVPHRDSEHHLRLALQKDGVALLAEVRDGEGWRLVGYALAAPLEDLADLDGPRDDPQLGRFTTLFGIALSVDLPYRGQGLGHRLKAAQVEAAMALENAEGEPRYQFMTGRIPVGEEGPIVQLNRRFGAYVVAVLDDQYGETNGQAIYYRIPLGPLAPGSVGRTEPSGADAGEGGGDPAGAAEAGARPDADGSAEPGLSEVSSTPSAEDEVLDLSDGVANPFGRGCDSLRVAAESGLLYGAVLNPHRVGKRFTPAAVRAIEWMGALVPALPQVALTSSRDELVDRALRLLARRRPDADIAIGLEGGGFGGATAAALALSSGGSEALRGAFFDWPQVAHPAAVGPEATLQAMAAAIERVGGADRILGVFVEAVQEHTGWVLEEPAWQALCDLRDATGVPLVLIETVTSCYRSGFGPFASTPWAERPDALGWWAGGQVGVLHLAEWLGERGEDDELAPVPRWGGDELGLIRLHHCLRAARRLDVRLMAERLDAALGPVRQFHFGTRGTGLYRVVVGPRAASLGRALRERGVITRPLSDEAFAIAPSLNAGEAMADRLINALAGALAELE